MTGKINNVNGIVDSNDDANTNFVTDHVNENFVVSEHDDIYTNQFVNPFRKQTRFMEVVMIRKGGGITSTRNINVQ